MTREKIITTVIRERKSIYANQYKKKKVPRKILEEILTNATWAPTHKMTEPWHFIILEGTEIDIFAKYMSDFYKNDYPDRHLSFLSYPKNAAYIIVIMMERNQVKNIPEWEEIAFDIFEGISRNTSGVRRAIHQAYPLIYMRGFSIDGMRNGMNNRGYQGPMSLHLFWPG